MNIDQRLAKLAEENAALTLGLQIAIEAIDQEAAILPKMAVALHDLLTLIEPLPVYKSHPARIAAREVLKEFLALKLEGKQ